MNTAQVSVKASSSCVIARKGKWTIFEALQRCCRSAVRSDDPFIGRHGLTEIELNKVLERNGFKKVRDRHGASARLGTCSEQTPNNAKDSMREFLPLFKRSSP